MKNEIKESIKHVMNISKREVATENIFTNIKEKIEAWPSRMETLTKILIQWWKTMYYMKVRVAINKIGIGIGMLYFMLTKSKKKKSN